MADESIIRRRALRVDQDPKHPLYMMTLSADELLRVADISRVSRDGAGKLLGYQRPEVKKHVKNIIEYLDSGAVIFPNSIILALSPSVSFKESRGPKVDDGIAEAGTLEIPLPGDGEPKPAWIVDGQQRALALSRCARRDFKVPVNAFIADDVQLQKDQFWRINSTKPLPRGLISELLPDVTTVLPPHLAARKAPASLCEMLNSDPESPFRGLIRRSSMTVADRKKAVVTDTVVMKMLEHSLKNPSACLFSFRNIATGETNFAGVRALLLTFWNAVKATFPDAWGLRPEKSRLMHGAGIRAMGLLMDRVMGSIDVNDRRASARVRQELAPLKKVCAWTEGQWGPGVRNLRWDDVENLPGHIQLLASFLIQEYVQSRQAAA